MIKQNKYIIIIFSLLGLTVNLSAQSQQASGSFAQILDLARSTTFAAKDATQQKQIAQQDYQIFKSSLKPALFLDGRIPGYLSTSSPITQQNGTIEFQRVSQNNANISLFGQQNIAATGGSFFVQSDLQRFDDFTLDNSLYNGIPLRIGIVQPIFGFNQIKWQKKLAPVALQQAERQYTFDLENTQFQATFFYFQILIANENQKIAQLNTEVNEKLLKIASKRLELGKISEDEKLQLEIELDNAKVNLRSSEYQLSEAEWRLWAFLGLEGTSQESLGPEFEIPPSMPKLIISDDQAVQLAMKNRPEIIAFQQQRLEAEQNIAQVKAETGPQANLFASFGLARGSDKLEQIYSDPFTEQQLNLTFTLPIVDWGKRKSSRKKAQIQLENTLASAQQQTNELEINVRLKVREFLMLQDAIQDQEAIRELAEKRFNIANERYILGAISITDFTLAQREKDQTRRNYIQTLSNYWNSYYALRLLTGYDFALNQKITY